MGELYSCTPGNYNQYKMSNVPDTPLKEWEIDWNDNQFTIKCNGVTVWTFDYADQKYPECAPFYRGQYGQINSFEFKNGADTASVGFYYPTDTEETEEVVENNTEEEQAAEEEEEVVEEEQIEEVGWQSEPNWEPIERGQKYPVKANMAPFKIRTEDSGSSSDVVWLKYYAGRWGMVRWRFNDYGVELYSCTPDNYNQYKMSNVPDTPLKEWEIDWNDNQFTIKCNGVTVWTFDYADQKYPECAPFYRGQYGQINSFEFKNGADTASVGF